MAFPFLERLGCFQGQWVGGGGEDAHRGSVSGAFQGPHRAGADKTSETLQKETLPRPKLLIQPAGCPPAQPGPAGSVSGVSQGPAHPAVRHQHGQLVLEPAPGTSESSDGVLVTWFHRNSPTPLHAGGRAEPCDSRGLPPLCHWAGTSLLPSHGLVWVAPGPASGTSVCGICHALVGHVLWGHHQLGHPQLLLHPRVHQSLAALALGGVRMSVTLSEEPAWLCWQHSHPAARAGVWLSRRTSRQKKEQLMLCKMGTKKPQSQQGALRNSNELSISCGASAQPCCSLPRHFST